jgi:hypothetical protein
LPPAPVHDPLSEEKQRLEAARKEIAGALDQANRILNGTTKNVTKP